MTAKSFNSRDAPLWFLTMLWLLKVESVQVGSHVHNEQDNVFTAQLVKQHSSWKHGVSLSSLTHLVEIATGFHLGSVLDPRDKFSVKDQM